MTRVRFFIVIFLASIFPGLAQLDGPSSTGVSASLIRLFGTNNAFTAQAEMQMLDKNNKELVGLPMNFALAGNKIRVEVDMNRMRNKMRPDATAQMKPLGLDQIVSVIHPESRTNLIVFPKLRAFVKLEMPENEAEAFLKRAKLDRTNVGKEKMEGYNCIKQRVIITDAEGQKSETTVWIAPELRNFPVCVATKEKEGVVTMRFRKVQFAAPAAGQFEPPAGFAEFNDMQMLVAGPGMKYMLANGTGLKQGKTSPAKSAPATSTTTTKKAPATTPAKKK